MIAGFVLPELVLESIIRDGLQNMKANPAAISDVFAQLTRAYNTQKYGQAEIDKIKTLITTKQIAVAFSYSEVDAKAPCFSIVLGSDNEDKGRTMMGDFYTEVQTEITDPVQLAALKRVINIHPTSYDANSGIVRVPDSVDLSSIYIGLIFTDSIGTDHEILGGIDNTTGHKMFLIGKNEEVDLGANGYIKSGLNYTRNEVRGVPSDVSLMIGCHSKDALTTKYLYILLKYFILSRKADLIKRGFNTASYNGTDLSREAEFAGDKVYSRFLTVTGKVYDSWSADNVQLIDQIVVTPIPVETV